MPFEIVVDAVARILRARYSGEVSLEERMALAGRVLREAERTGIYRLLLDFRDAQSRGAEPRAVRRIADEFAPRLPPDARLAYLLRYDHQLDDSLEVVARSRGVTVERFLDLVAAVAWLQADAPPPAAGARPAPGAPPADEPSSLRHALRLAAEVVEPGATLPLQQFAALGELVHELLSTGMDESTVRRLAGRVAHAMGQPASQ